MGKLNFKFNDMAYEYTLDETRLISGRGAVDVIIIIIIGPNKIVFIVVSHLSTKQSNITNYTLTWKCRILN